MKKSNIIRLFNRFLLGIVISALIFGISPYIQATASTVRYAKPDGLTSGTCDSWANACGLQYALSLAVSGEEIWVMQGTYRPTIGINRFMTFQLKTGVGLYGGFLGDEIDRSQRDKNPSVTILSGDIGVAGDDSDNAYHVVTGSGTDSSAVLNGFKITEGNANGPDDQRGAGMINQAGSPSLTNVVFENNSASLSGGGMYNLNNSPHLVNVTFRNNFSGSFAGGMGNAYSDTILVNVTFIDNSANVRGGGMLNYYCNPSLTNVSFVDNWSVTGAGIYNDHSDSTLINVTFTGNLAEIQGGALYNATSNPMIHNSILWDNSPDQVYNDTSNPTITYSDLEGECPLGSTCTNILNVDPIFVDPNINDLHLGASSPAIDAGDNTKVPADMLDLDGDGNTSEPLPYDLAGYPRFLNNPDIADTGNGSPPIVDMGAYEFVQTLEVYLPLIQR